MNDAYFSTIFWWAELWSPLSTNLQLLSCKRWFSKKVATRFNVLVHQKQSVLASSCDMWYVQCLWCVQPFWLTLRFSCFLCSAPLRHHRVNFECDQREEFGIWIYGTLKGLLSRCVSNARCGSRKFAFRACFPSIVLCFMYCSATGYYSPQIILSQFWSTAPEAEDLKTQIHTIWTSKALLCPSSAMSTSCVSSTKRFVVADD